jgi:1-acyl-sn-glycerol-3-phosphate acyltransferase
LTTVSAIFKLARALLHILVGFFTILLLFPRLSPEQRQLRTQVWSLAMLRCIGIELIVKGNPAHTGPLLLVANHMSWLDITSLHAARFCRFVSKADIKKWPFIGMLASGIGTLFIERESRRDAMRVVHHMTQSLLAGDVLGVFPEGTTTDGTAALKFHANLVQAAIAANAPIQPVALKFIDTATGQHSTAPCYIGEDTLAESVWRALTAPNIAVVIRFGEPQFADGRDRRAWALELQQAVTALRN